MSSSREFLYAVLEGSLFKEQSKLSERKPVNKLKLIIFSNELDLREPSEGLNIHQGCGLRKFLEDNSKITKENLQIVYIKTCKELCSEKEINFLKENKDIISKVYWNSLVDKNTESKLDYKKILEEETNLDDEWEFGFIFNLEAANVS